MEKKYISENRYKKSVGKNRRNISAIRKSSITSNKNKVVSTNIKKKKKVRINPSVKRERRATRRSVFVCIILILLIAVILRALLKEEGEPFIPLFFLTEENTQVITVGVITDEDLLDGNTNNVILKEMESYSNHMLLTINQDYSLNYDAIESINKTNDTGYVIQLNKSKEYNASTVKRVLDGYIKDKTSKYYLQLNGIQNISVINEQTLRITLKFPNPYFIYNLDIPVAKTSQKQYEMTTNSTSISVEFERTKYAKEEAPAKIIIKRYKSMYEGIEAYKKGTINMLVTNQKNVQNMLGKYEYNLKTYRNGETVFLFLNSSSEWLKNEEIRKVMAYALNRNDIVKDAMQSSASVIDLPYIYDDTKYKYDIYAAENLLLSNGYKKQNKIYTKNGKQVSINLIVNKTDQEKIQISTTIQNNLSAIGIKANIEKLSKEDMEKRIKKGTYDLVLSTVNLNNKPDISFLYDNLYMTDEVKNNISKIEQSSLINLTEEIKDVSKSMSNSISCIGIASKTNYVIYSKEIIGVGDISYLNVFRELIN